MPEPVVIYSAIVMFAIMAAGVVFAWRWELGFTARATPQYSRVRHIAAPWIYFAAMCVFVLMAAFFAQALFVQCCKWFHPGMRLDSDYARILATGVLDIGALAGALYARRFLRTLEKVPAFAVAALDHARPAPPIPLRKAVLVGAGVFCIIRAVLGPVAIAWNWLLDRLGAAPTGQELVEIFRSETSPARIAMLSFITIVIAPIAEEAVFRGGLFGYVRTRMNRQIALALPALIFAFMHLNLRVFLPLFAMSVILSIAYERTGRLTTNIVAHALFNLSTIILILLGVET